MSSPYGVARRVPTIAIIGFLSAATSPFTYSASGAPGAFLKVAGYASHAATTEPAFATSSWTVANPTLSVRLKATYA